MVGRVISSSEEQATGAFVDMLNDIRAEELLRKYEEAAVRKAGADRELAKLKEEVEQLIESNRGGKTGMHGFIGERVQVGFSNARAIQEGKSPLYTLVDDNGMTDYFRGKTPIQQKACISDKSLGLTHVIGHSEKYPMFLKVNGVYQIPRDFYEKYKRFLNMPEENALKLRKEDLRMWRRVQEFKTTMPDVTVEPMVVTYAEIQANTVATTIEKETAESQVRYQKERISAEYSCRATFEEGVKVATCSALLEGIVEGGISLVEHVQDGKRIQDFSKEDWKEIGSETAKGVGKGAIRGAAVYVATNTFNIPSSAATAAVTGVFVITDETAKYCRGESNAEEYTHAITEGCMDVIVSAVSSELGKKLIPIPILGSIIGNAVGMFVYKMAKTAFQTCSSSRRCGTKQHQ